MVQSTDIFFLDFIEYNVYSYLKLNKEAPFKKTFQAGKLNQWLHTSGLEELNLSVGSFL